MLRGKKLRESLAGSCGPSNTGVTLNFVFILFRYVFLFALHVFVGHGGDLFFFLLSSRSSGVATTFTTLGKATQTTTTTNKNLQNKTNNEKEHNEKHRLASPLVHVVRLIGPWKELYAKNSTLVPKNALFLKTSGLTNYGLLLILRVLVGIAR